MPCELVSSRRVEVIANASNVGRTLFALFFFFFWGGVGGWGGEGRNFALMNGSKFWLSYRAARLLIETRLAVLYRYACHGPNS